MTVGINATAAVKQPRTGVEEYTYQLIKYLTMLPEAREHRFFLYLPSVYSSSEAKRVEKFSTGSNNKSFFDFPLPENFEIKILKWSLPFLWTQIRLAWEMLRRPPEILFIPVHILPIFHPKNSYVTIHGLEYEYFPKYYPLLHRLYLRFSTKYALKHARKIIAISENTKEDLVNLYNGDSNKIEVVYHGINSQCHSRESGNLDSGSRIKCGMTEINKPYLLYLGRIEQKKNIGGILKAYKILQEKYRLPHKLVLAGSPGYGYDNLKLKIKNYLEIRNLKLEIKEIGYIDEDSKWQLLNGADVFLFPSFYEGFGLPVLEAQTAGVPVVTSFNSSLPEIAGEGALLVNPKNPEQIAEAVKSIIDDKNLRAKLIKSGYENVKRFSWEKCARETLHIVDQS